MLLEKSQSTNENLLSQYASPINFKMMYLNFILNSASKNNYSANELNSFLLILSEKILSDTEISNLPFILIQLEHLMCNAFTAEEIKEKFTKCLKNSTIDITSALHKAAAKGAPIFCDTLLFLGAQTEKLNTEIGIHKGKNALHIACSQGHLNCVKILVSGGADVNALTNSGSTPIHKAVEFPEIIEYLHGQKAALDHCNKKKYVLHKAVNRACDKSFKLLFKLGFPKDKIPYDDLRRKCLSQIERSSCHHDYKIINYEKIKALTLEEKVEAIKTFGHYKEFMVTDYLLKDVTKIASSLNILSLLNHYEYGTNPLNYEFKAVNFSARNVWPLEQDKIRHQFFLVEYIAKHAAYRDIFCSKPDNIDWKQVTTLLSTKADELIGMINALKKV